ncbi:response regulator [Jejuia pallidilutea]|uniref:Two-component response regulator n=1 Tax=Jejuia pallidilutea TaxID=504487 RepID=A0A098LNI3_9FLAO|nr:response regulator [Jejuia pallidilutea]GAL88551.1 two-component response regulator [Jejuia pallidilutea]
MKKILLIEDDTVLRENTAELLELYTYEVITAPNGIAGVNMAKSNLPDVIVCDIMMPKLDGYGVLQELSKNEDTKHIPFIFLSAKTERKDVRKGMNLGADDYITKPFNEDELVSAIESRLAKAALIKDDLTKTKQSKPLPNDTLHTLNDLKNFFDDVGETFLFSKGDVIYRESENSNYIYLIREGVVKNYKIDEDGKELITALYKEDDLFGYTSFTHNLPYQESATAMEDTELVGISKHELKDILDNNHRLALELIELLTDNLSSIKSQLLQMAYSSVNKKTAATILRFAEKINNKPEDPIKISRNDLASVAGVAPETFIRTLSKFKKEGLIDVQGRNIVVLNINKLQHIL